MGRASQRRRAKRFEAGSACLRSNRATAQELIAQAAMEYVANGAGGCGFARPRVFLLPWPGPYALCHAHEGFAGVPSGFPADRRTLGDYFFRSVTVGLSMAPVKLVRAND
jgi:hypothetical protein